jgi:hypothetical protein
MITPEEIKQQADKLWNNGRFLCAWLGGENLFPLEIPFRKVGGRLVSQQFRQIRDWLEVLRNGSKAVRGFGYSVIYKTVSHRQLGEQLLPGRIFVETETDFLKLTGRTAAFERFVKLVEEVREQVPELVQFIEAKPMRVVNEQADWQTIMAVCRYFLANPRPNLYLRQLDIAGVDTKFVEQNKMLLHDIFERILPPEAIDASVASIRYNGFERRYGLKFDEPSIRFRIMDESLAIAGLRDLCLPLSEFAKVGQGVQKVFILENKITGLSFPEHPKSLVVFGLGYGVQVLSAATWLHEVDIIYWGDIDTHGFAILSRLRTIFPHTRSFLMEMQTLTSCKTLWGAELPDKRFVERLTNLTPAEQEVYRVLLDNRFGENVRLEQERIPFSLLKARLSQGI